MLGGIPRPPIPDMIYYRWLCLSLGWRLMPMYSEILTRLKLKPYILRDTECSKISCFDSCWVHFIFFLSCKWIKTCSFDVFTLFTIYYLSHHNYIQLTRKKQNASFLGSGQRNTLKLIEKSIFFYYLLFQINLNYVSFVASLFSF